MVEHVVVVTDSLSVDGGSARVALDSARALAARGIDVTLFTAGGTASDELAGCAKVRFLNTGQGSALGSRNPIAGAIRGLWNQTAATQMGALLATLDPARTVIHVHGWTKALSPSVMARIASAGFPVVVTLHDYFSACPNGCLYDHRARKVCYRKPMSFACVTRNCDSRSYAFKLYRVIRQLIQRNAGAIPRRFGHYVTVSTFSRRVLEPMLPANSRFYAVNNPVDAVRRPCVAAEANAAFVYVGRLSAEKGVVLLAEAAHRANVPVVFVGEGQQRDAIARVNPKARLVGWRDRDGVIEQLRNARCVVMSSLWYETQGLAVLEAAALGVPAIVPTGTATHDLIEPGKTGIAFKRGDADDLAAQLRVCAADDGLVARLSRAAYASYWEKPPTMSAHIDRLLVAYSSVLRSHAHDRASERSA